MLAKFCLTLCDVKGISSIAADFTVYAYKTSSDGHKPWFYFHMQMSQLRLKRKPVYAVVTNWLTGWPKKLAHFCTP